MFDKDGSGAINVRELKALMVSVNLMCSDEEVEMMIKSVDLDGSGEIEFSEFLLLVSQRRAAEANDHDFEERLTAEGISHRFIRAVRNQVDSTWSRAVAAEERQLPMRKALTAIRRGSKLKSMLAFILFYLACTRMPARRRACLRADAHLELSAIALFLSPDHTLTLSSFREMGLADIALSTVRLDWWQGHETLGWLDEAYKKAGVRPLTAAEEVVEIADYLDNSLGRVINEV